MISLIYFYFFAPSVVIVKNEQADLCESCYITYFLPHCKWWL